MIAIAISSSNAENSAKVKVSDRFWKFSPGDVAVGRPILTASDVPADRVRALRKAFDETLADP
jgi:hypothetical protein